MSISFITMDETVLKQVDIQVVFGKKKWLIGKS
jgi:hypothetical protein